MTERSTKKKSISNGLTIFNDLPDCAYINLLIVCNLYGLSKATIWRNVKAKDMPQPIQISKRRTAWQVGQIRADLAKKAGVL